MWSMRPAVNTSTRPRVARDLRVGLACLQHYSGARGLGGGLTVKREVERRRGVKSCYGAAQQSYASSTLYRGFAKLRELQRRNTI